MRKQGFVLRRQTMGDDRAKTCDVLRGRASGLAGERGGGESAATAGEGRRIRSSFIFDIADCRADAAGCDGGALGAGVRQAAGGVCMWRLSGLTMLLPCTVALAPLPYNTSYFET